MEAVQTWGKLRDQAAWEVAVDHCAPWAGPAREKRYRYCSLGVVLSGCFEYHAGNGAGTAVPGTLLLGNPDEAFSCVHRSAAGNRRQVAQFHGSYVDAWAGELGL